MKKKLFVIITCLCMVFAFTACGGSGSEDSGFDVPFEKGTTDAAQITTNEGEVEETSPEKLCDLQDSNGAKFDTDYKKGTVIGVGIISEIEGSHKWNGYDMEASVETENGWIIEAASAEEVKDYEIGDVIAFKGKLSGVFSDEAMVFGKDENTPEIQLFAKAGTADAEAKDESGAKDGSAECYEENASLPKLDSVIDKMSEQGSSSSVSSGTAGDSISVEYTYEINASSADNAKALLEDYCDYVNKNGLKAQKQDSDTYEIKDGDTTIATIDFEDEDGTYYAELEIVEVDQSYMDSRMEELEDNDFDD